MMLNHTFIESVPLTPVNQFQIQNYEMIFFLLSYNMLCKKVFTVINFCELKYLNANSQASLSQLLQVVLSQLYVPQFPYDKKFFL